MSNPTTRRHDLAADAAQLRSLLVPGQPLLLANIWDPVAAGAVESSGLPAIATASSAAAPVNGGMGVGLAICRSIIASHGGRLWIANDESRGAKVSITLRVEHNGAP